MENIRKLKCELLGNQKDELLLVKNRLVDAASLVLNAQRTRNNSELVTIRQRLQQTINNIQVMGEIQV